VVDALILFGLALLLLAASPVLGALIAVAAQIVFIVVLLPFGVVALIILAAILLVDTVKNHG
jgi:hypothetical protein